jgi:glycosyltransferase involved in cell wall biosynthesis
MMAIKLSILICSLEKRIISLKRLLNVLDKQKTNEVEILINVDKGEKTVGTKRNELINKAVGDYICFIDDDDLVSDNYVNKILNAIIKNPDCVGIEGNYYTNGSSNIKKLFHSLRYKTWTSDGINYYRYPNHLNPVKREYAIKVGFKDINAGEDGDYSDRLLPFLKKEEYIQGPIYYYYYNSNNSETNINKIGLKYRNSVGGNVVIQAILQIVSPSYQPMAFNYANEKIIFKNGPKIVFQNNICYVEHRKEFILKLTRQDNLITIEINNIILKSFYYDKPSLPFSFSVQNNCLRINSFNLNLNGYKWTRPW